MAGIKHDSGKLRMDLIPPAALSAMAQALTMGAEKYGEHNWRGGLAYSRVIAAVLRHIQAWLGGEDHDPVDGQLHLGSALTGLAMLCEFEASGQNHLDDRKTLATAGQVREWAQCK